MSWFIETKVIAICARVKMWLRQRKVNSGNSDVGIRSDSLGWFLKKALAPRSFGNTLLPFSGFCHEEQWDFVQYQWGVLF